MKKTHFLFSCLALLVLLASATLAGKAMAAEGAWIGWKTLNGGGAPVGAGSTTLNASLGQPVTGLAEGASNIRVSTGYWYAAEAGEAPTYNLMLPVVLR